mmetsp:Transcript_117771/g.344995  ORF Transcript_117771/g.344995 Transcript_117771/m.344995 type:complete len:204 (-) Transcript_117771:662-1273(-)
MLIGRLWCPKGLRTHTPGQAERLQCGQVLHLGRDACRQLSTSQPSEGAGTTQCMPPLASLGEPQQNQARMGVAGGVSRLCHLHDLQLLLSFWQGHKLVLQEAQGLRLHDRQLRKSLPNAQHLAGLLDPLELRQGPALVAKCRDGLARGQAASQFRGRLNHLLTPIHSLQLIARWLRRVTGKATHETHLLLEPPSLRSRVLSPQ